MKLFFFIFLTTFFLFNCKQSNNSTNLLSKVQPVSIPKNEQFKGLSFVGNPKPITDSCLNAVTDIGANSITLMPFAFLASLSDPEVQFDFKNQWKTLIQF